MSSAWLLPEHIADVLPSQARQIEELRRVLLDTARGYGYELVIPPLLEYIDSLLSGTGERLDLNTFKLVDQLSGRTMGVRADATPQVARIDAHLLNRQGVTRLCYCVPTLRTRPPTVQSTREPLQFGAEIFGHQGLEADLEAIDLALDCVSRAGIGPLTLDLGHAGLLLAALPKSITEAQQQAAHLALASKDAPALRALAQEWPAVHLALLTELPRLYGDLSVLDAAAKFVQALPQAKQALADLHWLASRVQRSHPKVSLSVDLGDLGGNAYYTGARFAVYTPSAPAAAVVRGGRYDAVGAVFGRDRPAVGFGLDLKVLGESAPHAQQGKAIRAPAGDEADLRQAVRQLRQQGHTVLCVCCLAMTMKPRNSSAIGN